MQIDNKETVFKLAGIVLNQVESRDEHCAFWFVSALTKLNMAYSNMPVSEVLKFCHEAMPKAAAAYKEYSENT